ncbi:MAG: hypothetical protein ACRDZQ_05600 [Acidimicrobiales bacterium]
MPNTSLDQTVQRQVARVGDQRLGYVNATMALEDQAVGARQRDSIRDARIAETAERGGIWRTQLEAWPPVTGSP